MFVCIAIFCPIKRIKCSVRCADHSRKNYGRITAANEIVFRMSHESSNGIKSSTKQEISLQLEESAASHGGLKNELDSKKNIGICSDAVNVKLEIKEEYWWENETAEPKPQPETNFEFIPALKINKQESSSEENSIDEDLPFSESQSLTTEAVYEDGCSTCTTSELLIHKMTSNAKQLHKSKLCEKTDTLAVSNECVSEHVVTKPYKCDICDKSFIQKSDLRRHTFCHSSERPYTCENCGKSFNHKSDLKRHIFGHSGLKPYKCYSCEKSFNRNSDLKRHSLCHLDTKQYKCDSCEKSFSIKSGLIRHTLRHSGTKPYKCDSCKKSFNDQSNLIRHALCHTGIKPYKCDSCDKSFNDRSYLRKHALIHSGLKPYRCDNCKKSFNRKSHLTRHAVCHSGSKPVTFARRVSTVSQS